jgi:hypothetical protein
VAGEVSSLRWRAQAGHRSDSIFFLGARSSSVAPPKFPLRRIFESLRQFPELSGDEEGGDRAAHANQDVLRPLTNHMKRWLFFQLESLASR